MGFDGSLCYMLNKHTRGSTASKELAGSSDKTKQDKTLRGKGSRERWSDSTQIIPRARSETGGKPAFPDSRSEDGTIGLTAASRKE